MTIAFQLNGAAVEVRASSESASLADVLRDELHAKSVHLGCEQGVCGACTVLVDGRVARSCLMVAGQAEGRSISTSEGASTRHPELWPAIESAFVERGAFQCGFCTSGMVACLEELLLAGEPVTRSDVLELLSGQICRCTGYLPILEVFDDVLAKAGLLAAEHRAGASDVAR